MEASAGLGSAPVFLARGGQPHRRAPRQGERHGKNDTATTRLETTRGRPPIGGRPHSPAISKCRTGEPASSVDAHAVVLMVACRPPRGGSGTHPGCPHPVTGCRSGTFLTGRQRTQLHCDASHSLLRSHRPPFVTARSAVESTRSRCREERRRRALSTRPVAGAPRRSILPTPWDSHVVRRPWRCRPSPVRHLPPRGTHL